jgi:tRNA U34 5-methylaminomethyl-2-thiouridine-forming methyltransferase MnmC
MTDERVERLARQLLDEGYVVTHAEALLAAREVIAAAAAVPDPGDTFERREASRATREGTSPATP